MSFTTNKPEESNAIVPKICIVGAGFSGMCAGIQLKTKLGIHSFVIIERNHDVGGVWLTNTYPGVASDVASFIYSYSFALSTSWSKVYCGQEEIWGYLQKVARDYELYSHIRFNTSVKSMHWNENKKKWIVTTVNDKGINYVEEYDIIIVATGSLREPNKPSQFEAFGGPRMHSAEWNSKIRLENKVVGVVGNGASAVQIVPAIASKTKELIVYQRSAQHNFPKLQFRIPRLLKLFFEIPGVLKCTRPLCVRFGEYFVEWAVTKDSIFNKIVLKYQRAYISVCIKDKNLVKDFTPCYPIGVSVPTLSNKYYKTFRKPNVKLVTENIASINGTTITTKNGESKELDVLILCTGFKPQDFFAPIEIIGTKGVNLLQEWKKAWPRTYYGLTCHAAPNMFFLAGPNTFVPNSILVMMELQCKFLVKMIALMKKKGFSYFQVKKPVEDECWEEIKYATDQTVLGDFGNKRSYLINDLGENTFVWPKTIKSYQRKIRNVDIEKFNFA